MSSDGGGPPKKPVSLLTQALQKQAQMEAAPVGRARSNAFGNEAHFQEQTGLDIHAMRRQWAVQKIQSNPMQVYLHDLTHGGHDAVNQSGLLPKNQRNASIKVDYASTNNNTDVFVGGPKVMGGFFGMGLKSRSDFVHVIGKPDDFFPDNDYAQYLKAENDSVSHHGAIPPLRDARVGDTGPKSFMYPMTPRTKQGASRYLSGQDGYGDEAEAEIKRKFNARFKDMK